MMKKNNYYENTNLIVKEISDILNNIPPNHTSNLINQIIKSNRIFLVAIGRINISSMFGKRLAHLGFKVELVGSLTEK